MGSTIEITSRLFVGTAGFWIIVECDISGVGFVQVQCRNAEKGIGGVMLSETKGRKDALTFVLFRRPFEPSIQMYSARTLPLWSNFMYLANWRRVRFAQTKDTRNKTHVGSVRNDGRFTDA